MNAQFNELASRLSASLGENLVSVITYGSAIAAPGNPKKTDYQFLVVADRLGATELRAVRPTVQWWTAQGYAIPALFTAAEFRASLDVFPVEFRLMRRAYRVLQGADLLAGAEVSDANLRWQIEHELRGKMLRLRSLYPTASASTSGLVKLMTESVVSFVRFMRPLLELHGEEPPLGRLATVHRIGALRGIDTSALVRLLQLRDDPKELMQIEAYDLFADYLKCLEAVIESVDRA